MICEKCKTNKDMDSFSKNRSKKDGYNHICILCKREYNREHYRLNSKKYKDKDKLLKQRNREFVCDYLKQHPCVFCGYNKIQALHFHHNKGIKERNICNMIHDSRSIENIKKEMDKCIVLCANCHCCVTAQEQGWYKGII